MDRRLLLLSDSRDHILISGCWSNFSSGVLSGVMDIPSSESQINISFFRIRCGWLRYRLDNNVLYRAIDMIIKNWGSAYDV
jgi:hypothetical protein